MKKKRNSGNTRHLLKKLLSPKLWRKITSVLLAVTVFLTTYMMILPALTIDLDTVVSEPGMDVAVADSKLDMPVYDDSSGLPSTGESQTFMNNELPESAEGALSGSSAYFTEDFLPVSDISAENIDVGYTDETIQGGIDITASEDVDTFLPSEEPEAVPFEDEPTLENEAVQNEEIPDLGITEDYTAPEMFDDSLILPEEVGGELTEASDEFPEEEAEVLPADEQESVEDATEPAEFALDSAETAEDATEEREGEENNAEEPSVSSHVLKAEGEDYRVTVSYGDEAEIPEGAELLVTEILSDETGYEQYVNEASEALSTEKRIMSVENARFFDITIIKENEPVEPKAPVTVLVELADSFAAEESAAVIHYTEDEVKVVETVDAEEAAAGIEEVEAADAAAAQAVTDSEETVTPESAPEMINDSIESVSSDVSDMMESDEEIEEEAIFDMEEAPFIEDEPVAEMEEAPFVGAESAAEMEEIPFVGAESAGVEETDEAYASDGPLNPIAFVTDSFSVYGFVTATIEKTILASDGHNYRVSVTCGADAGIPEGADLSVEEIAQDTPEYDAYVADLENVFGKGEKRVEYVRLFDIKIVDAFDDAVKYQPAEGSQVDVRIELADTVNKDLNVVHFGENETEGVILDAGTDEGEAGSFVEFKTDGFSVFAVTYTVDLSYEVNGKTYEFSIPGGGFLRLTDLVEVLGIGADTGSSDYAETIGMEEEPAAPEYQDFTDAVEEEEVPVVEQSEESSTDEDSLFTPNDAAVFDAVDALNEEATSDGEDTLDAASTSDTPLTLNDIVVSDASRAFVENVESVEFSNPELVRVEKVEELTTVGEIKSSRGLECEYSAGLTEEQIAEINNSTVEAGDWALISMKPFTSEEALTVTMKNGEVFTVRVTDAQIRKTVIDAKGDVWEITVTYGPEAEIPDDATLEVEEILPGEERYDEYYRQSVEKIGIVNPDFAAASDPESGEALEDVIQDDAAYGDYAHIFDIQIRAAGQEIQPAADVSVNIKLLDAPEDENSDLKVVHFSRSGPEVMELTAENEAEEQQPEPYRSELNFMTDEFSVYTVVNAGNTNLNGQSYALVSGIANDPGATTGYQETWGRDYFTIIVNAHAMSNTVNDTGISSTGVHTWSENGRSYAGGEVPEWTFESAGSGKYYLTVRDKNGNKKYLTRNGPYDWDAHLSDSPNQYSQYTISANSDGTALIYYDGGAYDQRYYLYNDGNGEWATRTFKFRNTDYDTSSSAFRFRLCKKSDDFDSFAARKVSASTITTNTNYVIYRKFVDDSGKEELYALAHDGTFVRVYDGGDTIYWRETDKNVYWNYQMDGGYPVLFTQNPTTHETVYINPNHTTHQTLSSQTSGLTLLGKDNGDYGTAIECWDQTAYDYAGLHVTASNGTASLSTGTRTAGTSDEFLFAVAGQMPGATKETVDTVDSDSLGIKITMFDYGRADGWNVETNKPYAAGDKITGMTNAIGTGSDAYSPHGAHQLVRRYLSNGLPVSSLNGQELSALFSTNGSQVTYFQTDVNHLFLQSYYDESGTFRYRSEDNYAYLGFSGNGTTKKDFTVYRQAATPYTSNISIGHTYYHHGHFMPFNDIDMNNNLSRLMNQYGNDYQNGEALGEIPLGDGRSYEDIYGIQGTPNYYTGMKMEANFTQPRGGRLENGDEMVFKFTGDDDMWVYIDDVLVLDIGGIHEPLSGTIDFATGIVKNPTGSSLAGEKTLYQIFQDALGASGTPQAVKAKINAITWKDVTGDGIPDTFADYTNHSFSSFYMERGAGASNLDIQFNLKVVLTNQFTVQKELPEDIDDRFVNQKYKFRATYKDAKDGNAEKPLYAGAKNRNNETVCSSVVYKDVKDEHGDPVNVPVDENGYFYLKAGEAAIFKMTDESILYNVKEVDIDQYNLEKVTINGDEVTEHVEINDQQAVVTDNEASAGYDRVVDRSNVLYTNYPKKQNLLITKHLTDDSLPAGNDENPVFEFRVYLETSVTETDNTQNPPVTTTTQKLVPYSYGPYYLIKEIDGVTHYFTLNGTNNTPYDRGTERAICSVTGRSGSINSIPPEYTIVIPDLTVGTNFYIEERRDNIPSGYEFVVEELAEGTYDESSLIHSGDTSDLINRVLARDESDYQEFDPDTVGRIKDGIDAESHVYNRKPATGIKITKEWKRNEDAVEFQADYKIAWKLIQVDSAGHETIYATSGVFKKTNEGIILDDTVENNTDRRLTKNNATVSLDNLPMSEIVGGEKVVYTYRVEEDPEFSEAPAGSVYPFSVQTASVAAGTGSDSNKLIYTLTNDLNGSFKVTKQVQGASTDRSFTIRLKRTKDGVTQWLHYPNADASGGYSWGEESSASEWTFKDGESVTFTGLDTGYLYTAVEDTGTGKIEVDGYEFVSAESTVAANANVTSAQEYTGTVTNKYVRKGSLKLTKVVTIGGQPVSNVPNDRKDDADGIYTFMILKQGDPETNGRTVSIRIEQGAIAEVIGDNVVLGADGFVELTGLPAGNYVITEEIPINAAHLTKVELGTARSLSEGTVTVNVANGVYGNSVPDTGKARFTNNHDPDTGEDELFIRVTKTFAGLAKEDLPKNFEIVVKNETTGQLYHLNSANAVKDSTGLFWTWKITGISETDQYTVSEDENKAKVAGYTLVTEGPFTEPAAVTPAEITFTTGAVINYDSQMVWHMSENSLFLAALGSGGGGEKGTLVVSQKSLSLREREAIKQAITAAIASPDSDLNSSWAGVVKFYSVEENPTGFSTNGSSVSYMPQDGEVTFGATRIWKHVCIVDYHVTDPEPAEFNVSNTYTLNEADFEILKVDADNMTKPLKGAKFELRKIDPKKANTVYIDAGPTLPKTSGEDHLTGEDGKAEFKKLTDGYYEVKETVSPAGYIKTDDGCFFICIEGGVVKLVERDASAESGWKESEGNEKLIFTAAEGKNCAVITLGNTPGAVLPATGGPGTSLIYLLGIMLTCLAGVGLLMKRKWCQAP